MAIGGKGVSGQASAAQPMPQWFDYMSNPQKLADDIAKHERVKAEAAEALEKLAKGRDIEKLHADAQDRADTAKAELLEARKHIEQEKKKAETAAQVARERLEIDRAEFEKWAAGERAVIKAERKAARALMEQTTDRAQRAAEMFERAERDKAEADDIKAHWTKKRDQLMEALNG